MAASINSSPVHGERDLRGQTVVVIGGSSGIGLETARLARAKGADIILTARDPDRLHRAGLELGASIAAFDATDFGRLGRFFDALPAPIDHLLQVAWHAAGKVRPGGTLLFMGGTGGPRPAAGLALSAALTAALPAMTRSLALQVAPVRVNLIAAGFAGAPSSASPPGDRIEQRREQLRTTLPIGRVVGPADIATLAVHLMTNTAVTGATFDIDGGQQLVEGRAE